METIENKKDEKKNSIMRSQIIAGVVIGIVTGAVLGIGGTILNQHGKIERMTEQINQLEKQLAISGESSTPVGSTYEYTAKKVNPSNLERIIRNQQKSNIKVSHSENNCFTYEDLETFKNQKKHNQIVASLMDDNSFIDLIISIKHLTPTDRQALLDRCAKISRPTWGDLGKISSDGQTDAGNEAELLIAEAIVNKVKEISGLPLEKIMKQYK